jgi:hypothetical protein
MSSLRLSAATRWIIVCLAFPLIPAPAAAVAGTVTGITSCEADSCTHHVSYVAPPGERNDVRVIAGPQSGFEDDGDAGTGAVHDGIVEVADLTAVVTVGEGCVSVDPHRARCEDRGVGDGSGDVATGDLDDRVKVRAPCCAADWSVDAGSGDDRVDGGSVTYAHRRAPVFVDLRAGRGGEAGERDVLSGIVHLTGGAGDDRLAGVGGRDDTLIGGRGDDYIDGRGWHDQLWGGKGSDRLVGGPGEDQLKGEAGADRLAGGSGWDLLFGGEGDDYLTGGAGRDHLFGGPASDRLLGEPRDQRLDGGLGEDELSR